MSDLKSEMEKLAQWGKDNPLPRQPDHYRDAERRYMSDPVYHAMVNAMRNYMHEMTLTPSEMRSAVMLACIQFESQRVAPSVTALSRVPAEYLERDNG